MSRHRLILVVEDERMVRETLITVLQRADYTALGAGTGSESLPILQSNPVELVLLDFALPDMPGDVVGRRMKLLRPHIPIIVFSGYPEAAECADFAEAVIAKPEHPESLLEYIADLLGKSVP